MDENQIVVRYPGQDITCYPGSNQEDDGKLNLEYNMARIVTRLSSKNFCIVKPSFEITKVNDEGTNALKLQIGTGQCSINGMDLIMTNTLRIDPPVNQGTYHLAFKLARDSSSNVLGDLKVGVTTTFEGVYLSYFNEKPDPQTDMDMLYLGQITWDGQDFTEIVEDEDKYGRIWAEDVLGKFEDPKHPDVTRLTLQELIYNLPDWYFSKEGDTVYGPIIIADNRENNNPGIIMNTDENGSHITIKDPQADNDKLQFYGDVNRDGVINQADLDLINEFINKTKDPNALQTILADVNHDGVIDEKDVEYITNFINKEGNGGDTGNIYYIDGTDHGLEFDSTENQTNVNLGDASIYINKTDNYALHITNPEDIVIQSESDTIIKGNESVQIGTNNDRPKLTLSDDKASFTDTAVAPDLKFDIDFVDADTIQQTLGKAIWQYSNATQNVSLLQNNVNYLDIVPNGIYRQNLRVINTLYLGSDDSLPQTYLSRTEWWLRENTTTNGNTINFRPDNIILTNPTLSATDNSYISLRNSGDTIHTKIFDDAKIEFLNPTRPASIVWKDGNASFDITLSKIIGQKKLNLDGDFNLVNLVASGTVTGNGLVTSNGVITFKRGTNDATITKDNNANSLRTSGPFYVGASGTQPLYSGNTVVNGTFAVGGSTYANSEFKVDASGNLNTSGTITGSKVYNAVYNDLAEYMEKEDYDEVIEPGDVVCFTDNGKITKVKNTEDTLRVAGVVSSEDSAGLILGGDGLDEHQKVLIGLAGRIWVKVNCPVRTGNLLRVMSDGTVEVTNTLDRFVIGKATKPSEDGKVYMKIIN
jgi:hypothetical protein